MLRKALRYLTQREAQLLDEELMGKSIGYELQQLMELAGQSVASAIFRAHPPSSKKKVLVAAGPGNNGGDGLVAARHLVHFGYDCTVIYPKRPSKPFFEGLVMQAEQHGVKFVADLPIEVVKQHDLIVDAIFGFSFSGEIRPPFDKIIADLSLSGIPIVSVDIPSGWDVEKGNVSKCGLEPQMLISLTAPKLCAHQFTGEHWLGGRFVPPAMAERMELNLPLFPEDATVVRIN